MKNLVLNYIINNNDIKKFDCDKFFKDTESVDGIVLYVEAWDMENPLFSKILKYVSEKIFDNTKLMISLSNSATENIAVFSYLIKNHKEYRNWGLTIDEQQYDYININQSLTWLSEQDALTELNLKTYITTLPCIASDQFLLNSPHLERFYIGWYTKDMTRMLNNYTIQSYFASSSIPDKIILNISKRNNDLREIAKKCSLTLMMIRKFHRTLLSPLDKNVVKIISKFLYEQRYEPVHLKTLSISTSWEMKPESRFTLEEIEKLL
jgi:hypothetical protein